MHVCLHTYPSLHSTCKYPFTNISLKHTCTLYTPTDTFIDRYDTLYLRTSNIYPLPMYNAYILIKIIYNYNENRVNFRTIKFHEAKITYGYRKKVNVPKLF